MSIPIYSFIFISYLLQAVKVKLKDVTDYILVKVLTFLYLSGSN